MKTELLVKAAMELDALLFETPQIDFKQDPKGLTAALMEASKELEDDDKLSEETIDILAQIWEGKDGKLTVAVCEIFQELGILPPVDEKEKQTEDAEVLPETDDLVEEIEGAERIKDLKDIAKSNDEFKEIRGKLNGYKEIDDLRGVMMDILDGPVPEKTEPEETEPEEAPKAEKKAEKPKSNLKVVPKDEEKPVKKTEKKSGVKKPGVIAGIVTCIEKSGAKGISKEGILEKLIALFPDRDEKSMKNTINVQVPNRITKEKFPVVKLENGNYKKKA